MSHITTSWYRFICCALLLAQSTWMQHFWKWRFISYFPAKSSSSSGDIALAGHLTDWLSCAYSLAQDMRLDGAETFTFTVEFHYFHTQLISHSLAIWVGPVLLKKNPFEQKLTLELILDQFLEWELNETQPISQISWNPRKDWCTCFVFLFILVFFCFTLFCPLSF